MSVKQGMLQLQEAINGLLIMNTELLYKKGTRWEPWNGMDVNDLEPFVTSTLNSLKNLSENTVLLETIGLPEINTFLSQIISLKTELENLETMGFNNVTNQHHKAINVIHQINHRLRNTGLWLKLESFPEISKLETYLSQTESARDKARVIATEVEDIKNKAKKDLADKVKIDLIKYLNGQHETYRNFSYAILFVFALILSSGFLLIINPVWDSFQDFLLGQNNQDHIVKILTKVPVAILYVTILYILANFYKRYETLAIVMNHKSSVAQSLAYYSDFLFEETEKAEVHDRGALKQKIIEFEIKTLSNVFEQPATSEKMLNVQAGINEKGLNFSLGNGNRD